MNTNIRSFTALALACLALVACTSGEQRAERSQNTVSPQLDSGVTSDNGGGMRALRNNNSVGAVSTPVR